MMNQFNKLFMAALMCPVAIVSSVNAQSLKLPTNAQCYFNTVASKDLEKFAACFTEDAVIIDVNREIKGRNAIRTWANNEVIGGKYRLLEAKEIKDGISILLRFAPSGVGDGFRAPYDVTFKNGKIVRMNLQYA
jgi:hypothetical protein